jgi:multiple sugar transport system permease protein
LFIAPAILIISLLVAYPFCIAMFLSLSDAFVGRPRSFTGITNFLSLVRDGTFRQTLQNSFVFTATSVALKTLLGLTLALLLNQQLKLQRVLRGAVLLPWVIPTALSTLGWWWMFDSLYSVFNWTLIRLGILEVGLNWLGDKHLAMLSVITVNTWRGLPFFAVSLLAGLVAIPRELYEAAQTDGAGRWAKFWYITLPLLKPVLAIVVLFSTIFTFSDFNIVYVLTRGGPVNSTHLFATLARQVGLESGRIGAGAAISLFMFPVLVIVVYLQLRLIRKE